MDRKECIKSIRITIKPLRDAYMELIESGEYHYSSSASLAELQDRIRQLQDFEFLLLEWERQKP